jgi:uncharacterized protein (TIGR03435 family)
MKLTIFLCLPALAFAQFEVATVKAVPDNSVVGASSIRINRCDSEPGRFTCRGLTLKRLIEIAYDMLPSQVSGPGWMDTERYDVTAKPPAGATSQQINNSLRQLLDERFALRIRHKASTQSIYVLLAPHGDERLHRPGDKPVDERARGRAAAERRRGWGHGVRAVLIGDARMTMADLARTLSGPLERPVLNMTGLDGGFDVELLFAVENGTPPEESATHAPTVFEALQDQLGLKLEARRGEVDAIVVEEALKKPRDND